MKETPPTGLIFNIQKFSLHDGPGIRTVVFLKGCPLKCLWCANPESQKRRMQILWDPDKCQYCGICEQSCPQHAILRHDGMLSVMSTACRQCKTCISVCPHGALSAEGEEKTVQEVLDVCLQDRPFYEESDGGVTLSGGEAMMQSDFSIALLQALKQEGIHTAIETTGYVPSQTFFAVTEYVDLILFDVKHWNAEKHLEGTGVSNRRILENLTAAIAAGKEVLPRLPVIPGFNDTLADAEQFADILKKAGATRIQLLPFHQFGEKKYAMLGRTYAYQDVPALHEEDLAAFRQRFLDQGLEALF